LSAVGSRPKEALLVDILDPSRQVPPDFITYTLETRDGKLVTGFIVSENATSVTLRGASEPDQTILRSQIKEMRAEAKSLMPEGLEQGISAQDMSNLLAFLQKPDRAMLTQKP
jgi:putative heme-binding domain-containing protein